MARQRNPQKSLVRQGFNTLPEYVKCVVNPFDMPACGYPDYFNQPTIKMKLTETYTLSPDAAGNALFQVAPGLVYSTATNAVTANVIQAGVSSQHPDYATIAAQCKWARTVCVGVKVDYIGAPMTASGTLTVIHDTAGDYWAGSNPASCVDDGDSAPAIDGRKISLVPTQAPRFEIDTSIGFMGPTFEAIFLLGTGLAGTAPVFRVTIVRHVEGLPFRTATMARGNATKTTSSPISMVALSGVETNTTVTSDSWESFVGSAAKQAWSAVTEAAAPLARSAAMAAVTGGLAAFGL